MNICCTMFSPKDETIQKNLEFWKSYGALLEHINIIVVDDCSPRPVVIEPDFKINLKVARIEDDIFWNLPGARNLAFYLASDDWCINIDMDHFICYDQIDRLMRMQKKTGHVYYFERFRDGKHVRMHRDIFAIHRQDFNKIGGYDEDFSGCRGKNEAMINSIIKYFKLKKVETDIQIHNDERHGKVGDPKREYVEPNKRLIKKKLDQMNHRTYVSTPNLRFSWQLTQEIKWTD